MRYFNSSNISGYFGRSRGSNIFFICAFKKRLYITNEPEEISERHKDCMTQSIPIGLGYRIKYLKRKYNVYRTA